MKINHILFGMAALFTMTGLHCANFGNIFAVEFAQRCAQEQQASAYQWVKEFANKQAIAAAHVQYNKMQMALAGTSGVLLLLYNITTRNSRL